MSGKTDLIPINGFNNYYFSKKDTEIYSSNRKGVFIKLKPRKNYVTRTYILYKNGQKYVFSIGEIITKFIFTPLSQHNSDSCL